jgi:hypothetical protein
MITAAHIDRLVAKIGALIVGSGYARETAKPHLNHENYAYLGFMYTDPNTEERATLSLLKH